MGRFGVMVVSLMSLAMAGLAGCVSTSVSIDREGRVIVDDQNFAKDIKLVAVVCRRTPEGFLHSKVEVQNIGRIDRECEYCFKWRDKDGSLLTREYTPWRSKDIQNGRDTASFEAIAPRQDIADFRLVIRCK